MPCGGNIKVVLGCLTTHSPIDIDAEIGVLPDLEADVFLGIEEVMNHLVVDLQITNRYQALGGVRCESLKSHHRHKTTAQKVQT